MTRQSPRWRLRSPRSASGSLRIRLPGRLSDVVGDCDDVGAAHRVGVDCGQALYQSDEAGLRDGLTGRRAVGGHAPGPDTVDDDDARVVIAQPVVEDPVAETGL